MASPVAMEEMFTIRDDGTRGQAGYQVSLLKFWVDEI
jgi:hypothetical protein